MYCPLEKKLRYLSDPNTSLHKSLFHSFEDKQFLGWIDIPQENVDKIVGGLVDPNTLEELKIGEFEDLKIDEIMENGKSKDSWKSTS